MKDYTSTDPVFSESIPVVEEDDLVNAENNNASAIQLLQNILIMAATKVDKEEGKSLVSDTERDLWNMIYQNATGYTDQKIADLIGGAPSTLDTLGEIAKAMADNADVVEALNTAIGSKANQAEMESLLGTKLDKTGDSKDNTITFTSSDTTTPSAWTDVATLKSGETHKNFAQKVSTMFKNLRYLWKILGSTNLSGIGDGTVTGAINALNTGLGNIGYIRPASSGNADIPSSPTVTPTPVCSIWLPPGVYLIESTLKYTLENQARIETHINSADHMHTIGSASLTLPDGIHWVKNTGVLKVEETSKQIVLSTRQNSGSTLECTGNIKATRIR